MENAGLHGSPDRVLEATVYGCFRSTISEIREQTAVVVSTHRMPAVRNISVARLVLHSSSSEHWSTTTLTTKRAIMHVGSSSHTSSKYRLEL